VADEAVELQRSVDARYVGEGHEVQVLVDAGPLDAAGVTALCESFHDVHDRTFGYAYRGEQEVEIVNLRVEALGRVNRPTLVEGESNGTGDATPTTTRPVWFAGGLLDCPIYARDGLAPGTAFTGPAVVEEFGSTIVVRPGWRVSVDPHRNLKLERD
jgi:N-methylhydantoinase A